MDTYLETSSTTVCWNWSEYFLRRLWGIYRWKQKWSSGRFCRGIIFRYSFNNFSVTRWCHSQMGFCREKIYLIHNWIEKQTKQSFTNIWHHGKWEFWRGVDQVKWKLNLYTNQVKYSRSLTYWQCGVHLAINVER